MNKKLRIDTWNAALSEAQCLEIYTKTRNLSWSNAVELIAKEYGVKMPAKSAFFRFTGRMRSQESTFCHNCHEKDAIINNLSASLRELTKKLNK